MFYYYVGRKINFSGIAAEKYTSRFVCGLYLWGIIKVGETQKLEFTLKRGGRPMI